MLVSGLVSDSIWVRYQSQITAKNGHSTIMLLFTCRSLEWSVDFCASLAGESLHPGLLPMHLVNVSAIEFSLVSSSVVPKYQLIDVRPLFLFDYKKGFRLLLNWRANSSHLSSLQTILTQGYKSGNTILFFIND